jgi:hypothetical protein
MKSNTETADFCNQEVSDWTAGQVIRLQNLQGKTKLVELQDI